MQLKTFTSLFSTVIIMMITVPVFAQSVDEIQIKIDSRSADIRKLETDIVSYQSQILALSTQAKSLSNTLKELDLTRKKLEADIHITEDKIDSKNLQISQLSKNIGQTEQSISENKRYIAESLKKVGESSSQGITGMILSGNTISDSWNNIVRLIILEENIQSVVVKLGQSKTKLVSTRMSTEKAKRELLELESQLTDQKKIVLDTISSQRKLLSDTNNSEASYNRQLKEKLSLKNAFEKELLQFESDLKLAVDMSKLPKTGSGVLSWPINKPFITQYFGNTTFATANAQLYSGAGHNGIDLRATVGTPIKASLSGIVVGTGNTDIYAGCYSLGKWMLVRHSNGLSTLYAHLSLQAVPTGATVDTGQIIGYSGDTGYTTGPHLHFGVYASSGIEIKQFKNSAHCAGAMLPVATLKAYLNPLSYLPTL